jgi:hypothetical protein
VLPVPLLVLSGINPTFNSAIFPPFSGHRTTDDFARGNESRGDPFRNRPSAAHLFLNRRIVQKRIVRYEVE